MPVIDVQKDLDNRRLIMTAQFAAPVERIWQLYADPRQLEKVWGPPTHPATFVDHDLTPGGRMTYFMTAPDGQKYCGFWDVKEVDEPRSFTFEDGFANEDFTPDTSLPVGINTYSFSSHDDGTRAVYEAVYPSVEALQQVLDMGVVEGATGAINQIDAFLAEG
ncbi:MAG TPA: SRPBCC domain-containing protein [Arachnia sp.]|nr:SRPBCC domain-containing protein [Arachnia sp.]